MTDQKNEEKQDFSGILLEGRQLTKTYGKTVAVDHFDITIGRGEVIGLLGSNGAGKSTLTRLISGVSKADSGEMTFDGQKINMNAYTPRMAESIGIRVVYQELSLCTNLKVYENFFVELNTLFKNKRNWRKAAAKMAREQLDDIFPNHGIDVTARLDSLSIAQMQMVEIARALCDPKLKLLILDEPTSSLPAEQTKLLQQSIRRIAAKGVSFVFITHRLSEAITIVDRVYVAAGGALQWQGNVAETSEADLIVRMGGDTSKVADIVASGVSATEVGAEGDIGIAAKDLKLSRDSSLSFDFRGGEIIGIAGLEGSGQRDLLHKLFANRGRKGDSSLSVKGRMAYVTGDRKKEGNLPLWSVFDNMMINHLAFQGMFKICSTVGLQAKAKQWYDKLDVKSESLHSGIGSLSGGNQQKVLIARALVSDADIILLDDPTRGVDISTKYQLYEIFSEAARSGKLVIWYSSDDDEFKFCSRVLVMRYHRVVAQLSRGNLDKNAIVEASFYGEEFKPANEENKNASARKSAFGGLVKWNAFVPLTVMLIVYALCCFRTPRVFSIFGVELLLSSAAPLIFLALGQMFIIGFSQCDLGIGAFMGVINVVTATFLYKTPAIGTGFILLALLLYGCMGLVIYFRNIPPIIMTLGASFIWEGIALYILPSAGGTAPSWLTYLFWMDYTIPPTLVLIILFSIIVYLFYKSKYGVVMQGFGNNASSMVRSGWSESTCYFLTYVISGICAMLGGLVMAGVSGAADGRAAGGYTMLTVASVIIGGGYFTGGKVTVWGTVFGAITFSLISSLLGFYKVSTQFTAAVQGIILILILAFRLLKKGRE